MLGCDLMKGQSDMRRRVYGLRLEFHMDFFEQKSTYLPQRC